MKKDSLTHKPLWIAFLVLAIVTIGASLAWAHYQSQSSTRLANDTSLSDAQKFQQEYPKAPEANLYVYASTEEVFDIFEQGSGIVFLGFPECPWCQHLAPILNEAAVAEGIDKIYYLNIRQARADNDENYQKLVSILGEYLDEDEQGEPRIYVPDVTAVNQGNITLRFTQESPDPDVKTPDDYWTAERRANAVEQLRDLAASTK